MADSHVQQRSRCGSVHRRQPAAQRGSNLHACARVQAIAEVFLAGDCFTAEVSTRIAAETSGSFEVIEGCERGDFSFGDASGSTDGSTAEGVRPPLRPCHTACMNAPHACM